MRRAGSILALALALLAGCGDAMGGTSEADIANRASAITRSAEETVNEQIADIERASAEDAAQAAATAPLAGSNAANADAADR